MHIDQYSTAALLSSVSYSVYLFQSDTLGAKNIEQLGLTRTMQRIS